MDNKRYTVSQAVKVVGVESHVLRFWEEQLGLSIARNDLGHRIYTERDIEIFFVVKEWKKQGIHLKEMANLVKRTGDGAVVLDRNGAVNADKTVGSDRLVLNKQMPKDVSDRDEGLEQSMGKQESLGQESVWKDAWSAYRAPKQKGRNYNVRSSGEYGRVQKSKVVEQVRNSGSERLQKSNEAEQVRNTKSERVCKNSKVEQARSRGESEEVRKGDEMEQARSRGESEEVQKSNGTEQVQSNGEPECMQKMQQFREILQRVVRDTIAENHSPEGRYKKVDATIRHHQRFRKMVAAARDEK